MTPGGYAVTQSSSPFFTREVFWCIARTWQAAGFETHSYHVTLPSFGVWGFNLAGSSDGLPREFPVAPGLTRYLSREVMTAASVFPADMSPVTVPVNSMFEPRLYEYYREGLQH